MKLYRNKEWHEFKLKILKRDKDITKIYKGENKRGAHHYDSSVYPYIATAIVKGKWNVTEYKNELTNIISLEKMMIRGVV